MVFVVLCPFLKAPNLATDRSFDIGISGADMYGTHMLHAPRYHQFKPNAGKYSIH